MRYQQRNNRGFDEFLINEWRESWEEMAAGEGEKETRKQAYQAFRKAVK